MHGDAWTRQLACVVDEELKADVEKLMKSLGVVILRSAFDWLINRMATLNNMTCLKKLQSSQSIHSLEERLILERACS